MHHLFLLYKFIKKFVIEFLQCERSSKSQNHSRRIKKNGVYFSAYRMNINHFYQFQNNRMRIKREISGSSEYRSDFRAIRQRISQKQKKNRYKHWIKSECDNNVRRQIALLNRKYFGKPYNSCHGDKNKDFSFSAFIQLLFKNINELSTCKKRESHHKNSSDNRKIFRFVKNPKQRNLNANLVIRTTDTAYYIK